MRLVWTKISLALDNSRDDPKIPLAAEKQQLSNVVLKEITSNLSSLLQYKPPWHLHKELEIAQGAQWHECARRRSEACKAHANADCLFHSDCSKIELRFQSLALVISSPFLGQILLETACQYVKNWSNAQLNVRMFQILGPNFKGNDFYFLSPGIACVLFKPLLRQQPLSRLPKIY